MAFPQTPLDVLVELMLNGSWTDVTDDVYLRDGIDIDRGRSDWASHVDPTKCTLTFNNRDGKYSPRNPTGALYGQIGRNTPLRVSVNAGSTYLEVSGDTLSRATTPDAAAIDLTGDIDVRIEAQLENWEMDGSAVELAGKWNSGSNQRSWLLFVFASKVWLYTSADGTAEVQTASTTTFTVPRSGRMAVRATIDVNNGASGKTVTFYTATSMAGPWTQLGDAVTTAGTTSIFNSTAALDVGNVSTAFFEEPVGRIYKFELRNGIGGTAVANPDFTVQAAGASSFVDAAGRTWSVVSPGVISNRRTRFVGEVSSWPVRWDVSGKDVYVQVEAAGIMRRMSQGAPPLHSALTRRIPLFAPLLAYWPLEEGASATRAYSPISGVPPLEFSHVKWAGIDTLASSSPLPTLDTASGSLSDMKGRVPVPTGVVSAWNVAFFYKQDTAPTTPRTLMRVLATGTVAQWFVQVSNDTTRIIGRDASGDNVFQNDFTTGSDLFNQWVLVEIKIAQDGGNVDWSVQFDKLDGTAGGVSGSVAGTAGYPLAVSSPPDGYSSDLSGMGIGHISVWGDDVSGSAYGGAFIAWSGESAGDRMRRLIDEEDVAMEVYGDGNTHVGPQTPQPLLDLLAECADVDHGILYEDRETVALRYRDLDSMLNQPVALALDYTADGEVDDPLEPVDDDQSVKNDVTVTRTGGSSTRITLDEGPLSTLPPPDGVGPYAESVTLNLWEDSQTGDHASWLLHLGTWDETRYPVLHVELAAAPHLVDDVTDLDLGDRITISNPPAWLPPDAIDLLAQGYTETLGLTTWTFAFNCTPAGPFDVAFADADDARADTSGSELNSSATSTATSISVATTAGPVWTQDGDDLPFDIRIAGEVMTVTAVSGSTSPQTFTVTRSVNGVIKAQDDGAKVELAHPSIVAL